MLEVEAGTRNARPSPTAQITSVHVDYHAKDDRTPYTTDYKQETVKKKLIRQRNTFSICNIENIDFLK